MTSNKYISLFNEIHFGRIREINKYLWGTETCQTLSKHHINGEAATDDDWIITVVPLTGQAHLLLFFERLYSTQPTVFIPLNLTVYVVCGVRHMLRMCVLWCAVCIACYGCGAECVSHVRIICGWRYYFMTSSVKPLKHYGKKLGVNISSCSEILQ